MTSYVKLEPLQSSGIVLSPLDLIIDEAQRRSGVAFACESSPDISEVLQLKRLSGLDSATLRETAEVYSAIQRAQILSLPSFDYIARLEDAYWKIKPAYDLVSTLRSLPHVRNANSGWEYEFASSVWNERVLPLIGSTKDYQKSIEAASNAYEAFGADYLGGFKTSETILFVGDFGTPATKTVSIEQQPAIVASALMMVTRMMMEVATWQGSWNDAQIECEGTECAGDDASEAFSTAFLKALYLKADAEHTYFFDPQLTYGATMECSFFSCKRLIP